MLPFTILNSPELRQEQGLNGAKECYHVKQPVSEGSFQSAYVLCLMCPGWQFVIKLAIL